MKYKVSSPFGERVLNGKKEYHNGIDLVYQDNKEVRSFSDGVVTVSTIILDKSNNTWEWGHYVRVDGKDGLRYYYCHLDKRLVKKGDQVKAGDVIGIMGNTGHSFGEHTHFEVRNKDGKPLNPTLMLPKLSNKKGIFDYIFKNDIKAAEIKQEEVNTMDRYDSIEQVPGWARPTIKKLVDTGSLQGDAKGNLALTDDMIRTFVILDREGLFDRA